jgi:hypothetical protein
MRRAARVAQSARVEDDSGEARLDARLTYRGVPVVEEKAGFTPVTWGGAPRNPQRQAALETRDPRRLPPVHHRVGLGREPRPELRAVPRPLTLSAL